MKKTGGAIVLLAGLLACGGDGGGGAGELADLVDAQGEVAAPGEEIPSEAGSSEVSDFSPPVVVFVAPLNGDTVRGEVQVSLRVQDDTGVARVSLAVDGNEVASLTSDPYTWTWDTTGLANGNYTLSATAYDMAGNTGTASVTVLVEGDCNEQGDCPPRGLRILYPIAEARVCGTIPIEATALDDQLVRMEFLVDGLPLGVREASPFRQTWDTTGFPDGLHVVKVVATNAANLSVFATRRVTVDNQEKPCDNLPFVQITEPVNHAWVTGVVAVKATTSDDLGVTKVQFWVDNGLRSEDKTVPYRVDWDTSEFEEGSHVLKVVALDTASQDSMDQIQVTIDRTPPEVRLDSPQDGVVTVDTLAVSASATDNSGVVQMAFRLGNARSAILTEAPWTTTFDVSELASGEYLLQAEAMDRAGLTSVASVHVAVDRPPTVAFVTPTQGTIVTGAIQVQVAATDDLGLESVEFLVDGEPLGVFSSSGTFQWTPTYGKGDHVLKAIARDSRGQTAEAEVAISVDWPLTVTILACGAEDSCTPLQEGQEVFGIVSLKAEASDDAGPVETVRLLVDGEEVGIATTDPKTFAWDSTTVSDGDHEIRMEGIGVDGTTGTGQATVRVNNCDRDQDTFLSMSQACGGNDCDDGDASFHPGAIDFVGDAADQNCDGVDGVDTDRDGHASVASGGRDCDDGNQAVHPCADDLPGDGVDANCDGRDVASCDDCVVCTDDSFDGGTCLHLPAQDGQTCDDRNPCTVGETCSNGRCTGGTLDLCDDDNPCTTDSCNPLSGCVHRASHDGEACESGVCWQGACCTPQCGTRVCGDDGCGGSCGTCESGMACMSGQCVVPPVCPDGYVHVEAGVFLMGSPTSEPGADIDEGQHWVTISRPFCMKRTEVTQGEWNALMGNNPSTFNRCGMSCPVERVSWWDAAAYANQLSDREALPRCYILSGCSGRPGDGTFSCTEVVFKGLSCSGYRLPTEAEWEYAARAGTTTATYNGTSNLLGCEGGNPVLGPIAWFCGNASYTTHAVQGKDPNAWGLHDMLGNVSEWVGDWYNPYPDYPVTDPTTSDVMGLKRVIRGGSWTDNARAVRAAYRYYVNPDSRRNDVGFRLVRAAFDPSAP